MKTHPAAEVFPLLEGPAFEALCTDIKQHGLREAIVVKDDVLLDGRNRLRACEEMGVVPHFREYRGDDDSIIPFIVSMNIKRRHLTPSQIDMASADLVPLYEAAAADRARAGTLAPIGARVGKSTALAAESVGASERGTERALEVKRKGVPELAAAVRRGEIRLAAASELARQPEETQRSILARAKAQEGEVRGGHVRALIKQEAKAAVAREIEAEPPPMPTGPYRVLVADPPWAYTKRAGDVTHRGDLPYPPMTTEEICKLQVPDLAHPDGCILWLWTTNAFLRDAYTVLDSWGFEEKTVLTWVKDRMGLGDWLRGQTEHCILAVRGRPTVTLTNQTTVLHGPLREHSRKPEEFYNLVEALCPGSKVELFCRTPRAGWAMWGAETDKFDAA